MYLLTVQSKQYTLIYMYLKFRLRVFRGFRLVTLGSYALRVVSAARGEEVAEEFGGFVLKDAAVGGDGVVQAGVGGSVVEGARVSGFGVGGGEDEAGYSGGVEGSGAHGAGFEGGVEGAAGESPGAEGFGGAAECEYLGVGGRVSGGFSFVGRGGDGFAVAGDYGSNGDFAFGGGLGGGGQGVAHHGGVEVWLKVSRHTVDNSRVMIVFIERGWAGVCFAAA